MQEYHFITIYKENNLVFNNHLYHFDKINEFGSKWRCIASVIIDRDDKCNVEENIINK
jgi:hypothetical protein